MQTIRLTRAIYKKDITDFYAVHDPYPLGKHYTPLRNISKSAEPISLSIVTNIFQHARARDIHKIVLQEIEDMISNTRNSIARIRFGNLYNYLREKRVVEAFWNYIRQKVMREKIFLLLHCWNS